MRVDQLRRDPNQLTPEKQKLVAPWLDAFTRGERRREDAKLYYRLQLEPDAIGQTLLAVLSYVKQRPN